MPAQSGPNAVRPPAVAACASGECGCGMRDFSEQLQSLWNVIGDTPLLQIRCRCRGIERCVYAKYEAGIAFAAVGRALGHPVQIFMPDWMSHERAAVIASLGATVVPVSAAQGGFRGSILLADRCADLNAHTFRPNQFDNRANVESHRQTTGPELLAQIRSIGLTPTSFVAGVGTGGTRVSVGEYLREPLGPIAVHPLEPANSPTLRTGSKRGSHRIQGISDDFIPSIVDLKRWDPVLDVWDGDAIIMAQRLSRELGLAVGISSGANFLGALTISHQEGSSAVAATVFADDNKKYLSTDLCRAEPALDHYLSPGVELTGVRVISRANARRTPGRVCGRRAAPPVQG